MSFLPKTATAPFCPLEVRGSVDVPPRASQWRKWFLICGPAFLVSIGYIDPGNWATDIAAGSKYGYDLLFIILLSNIAAIFLQGLSVRVGIATGRDLARLSRDTFSPHITIASWLLAEMAIIACDVAEVLGGGLAFHLLFGCSLTVGILLTMLDTTIVLGLKGRGFREVEAIILGLLLTVGACFAVELVLAGPPWLEVAKHMIPSFNAVRTPDRLYLAIGIIGATVMPHNLYLHSSIVQTRKTAHSDKAKRETVFFNNIDIVVSLSAAFLINAAILILSSSAFHSTGQNVTGIEDAYHFLVPALGSSVAMYAFGIGLLASGQSSTFTGTIAGQVILEGFLDLKIPCWVRRIITRSLALIPALGGVILLGDAAIDKMMVLSQVILGLQLPLVMYPLFRFASDRKLMGDLQIGVAARLFAWFLFAALTLSNIWVVIGLV